MKVSRVLANLVGAMILIQVILGGSSVLLGFPIDYHLYWGILTFIALVAAAVLIVRDYGSRSTIFRVALAAIVDFILQGVLGFFSFGSDAIVVVHLTNAFILAVMVTFLISFADRAVIRKAPSQAVMPGSTSRAVA